MKKKLLMTLLSICFIVLCSCSKNNTTSVTNTNTVDESTNENVNTDESNKIEEAETTDSNDTTSNNDSEVTTVQSLDDVENYLKSAGVLTGEKTEMAAEMVGAVNGFKYLDNSVEVYEFDIESEAYKKVLETNEMDLTDFGTTIPVNAINGKYVLYCDESATKDDIIKVFNEMK
jgi:hypothetical protein